MSARLDQKSTNHPARAESATPQQQPARETLGITAEEFNEMGAIGAMYYQQGNLEKAQAIFEGLVELDPQSSAAHAALGALLTRTEDFDRALIYLNRAVELDPQEIAPYVNRAEIFIRQQLAEQAVVDLKRAIALDPKETDPAANRARAMALGIAEALRAQGVTQQTQHH
jgi:tetratricopeptide (TPR) repeat protein